MTNHRYEHHLSLKDNLCPFISDQASISKDEIVANWHRNIEVLVITDGSGFVQYGADEIFVEKDDIIIVDSGALHRPHSKSLLSYNYIIIDEDFCLKNGFNLENCKFKRCFKDDNTKNIFFEAVEKIKNHHDCCNLLTAPIARNAVLSLLIDIYKNHLLKSDKQSNQQNASEKYVKQTIDYLSENFTEQTNIDFLARMCNITKFHLIREFKRYTGQTICTYVNILKCKKAEACLSEGLTVTETATECGFDNVSYFSQVYKKMMGVSPKKTRK